MNLEMVADSGSVKTFKIFAGGLTILITAGCGGAPNSATHSNAISVACAAATCVSNTPDPVETQIKYGFACRGDADNASSGPAPKPIAYLVADRKEPGFPRLTKHELQIVQRYSRNESVARTLRLAWLAYDYGDPRKEFIVFNDTAPPCRGPVGGFKVLNGGCNDFYDPSYDPYRTRPGSGCLGPSR